MTETCTIKKVKGNFAYIEVKKHSGCPECRSCLYGTEETLVMPALMDITCKEGDTAQVEMPKKQYVVGPFMFFGFFLILFIIGLFVGRAINSHMEWVMVIGGFVGGIFGLLTAHIFNRLIKNNKKYMPVVTGVYD